MPSFRSVLLLGIISIGNFLCISKTKEEITKTRESTDSVATTSSKIFVNIDTLVFLKIAREFSEGYKAQSTETKEIVTLENIPDSVINAFKQLRIAGNVIYGKYLTLIFLKLYRSHLQCCHQGYELRTGVSSNIDSIVDPLLYEFNLISKTYNNSRPIEFINSGFVHTWLEKNKYLLEYDKLKKEYQKIEKINAAILKDPSKYY